MVYLYSTRISRRLAAILAFWIAFVVSSGISAKTAAELTGRSAAQLMEKAAYQETVVGDLDAAKKIYQEILRLHRTNQVIADNAKMRLKTIDLKRSRNEKKTEKEGAKAAEKTDSRSVRDFNALPVDLQETLKIIRNQYIDDLSEETVLTESALRALVTELDSYSSFVSAEQLEDLYTNIEGDLVGIGVVLDAVEGRIVVRETLRNSPAADAGIVSDDVIVAVDGSPYEMAGESNPLSDFVKSMRGKAGSSVVLTIQRSGVKDPMMFNIIRRNLVLPSVEGIVGISPEGKEDSKYLLPNHQEVGYIKIGSFSKRTAEEIREIVSGLQAGAIEYLVIDLRDCAGGLLKASIESADLFLDAGVVVRLESRKTPVEKHFSKHGQLIEGTPIAILVNRGTASAAELFAAAMQDRGRAKIFGERTFGKGSVQGLFPLPNGGAIKLTTARFIRVNGKPLDKPVDASPDDDWGVIPDVQTDPKSPVLHFKSDSGVSLKVEAIHLQNAGVIKAKTPADSVDQVLKEAVDFLKGRVEADDDQE